MAIVYLLFISSSCLLQWSGAFTPVVYNSKILPSSQCDQSDPFEDDQQLMEALKMAQQQLPPPECNPLITCSDVHRCNSSATSGYFFTQCSYHQCYSTSSASVQTSLLLQEAPRHNTYIIKSVPMGYTAFNTLLSLFTLATAA